MAMAKTTNNKIADIYFDDYYNDLILNMLGTTTAATAAEYSSTAASCAYSSRRYNGKSGFFFSKFNFSLIKI